MITIFQVVMSVSSILFLVGVLLFMFNMMDGNERLANLGAAMAVTGLLVLFAFSAAKAVIAGG